MTVRMTLLRVEGNVKLQKQRVSRWRREKVQMNHELYLVKVVNSNKSVSMWQNISPSTAQTVISKCRHQYAAQQAVSSVVWSCSCKELLDVACIRANDSCWTLILYSKPKAQGISQPKIWWRKKERGGNQCVQWRCKAHVRCPCFPGNFLKPYSQPVTEKWMGKAGHGLSFPAWKKIMLSFPGDLPGVTRPMRGGVLLGVGEDRVMFSHALLSVEALVYGRIPNCPPHI